ncbi:MAG TPA: porin [Steroidobacteraceae bacterium]|nr:porin [Steroidobacteraceae bacterium]
MVKSKLARPMLVALAACAASVTFNGVVFADDAQTQALKNQMQQMQKQMQQLQQQLDAVSAKQQAGPPASAATPPSAGKKEKAASTEPKFDQFLKGFYGSLDLSVDYTTKGINNPVAYPWGYATGAPGSPYVITGAQKAGPYGKVGWLGAMSSNGSSIGYRGAHRIPNSNVDFIYQVSTAIDMSAAPGLRDTWTKSSNTVQGAIGLGDTFLGFQSHSWGKVRFGEMYMPYKTSTDRLNPFGSGLGNYAVIMGNTGGDNRVEFGTRGDDVVAYSSPTWAGFSFDAAYQFGQQLDPNSDLTPLGSPDCNGSNNPGSGNLFLNCDDGGYDRAYSADLKFSMGGLYLVGAYEIHKRVNRSSDGIGSNSPYYQYLFSQGPTGPNAALLDWADYTAYANEYPGAAAAGSPAYSTAYDIGDEWAMKFGAQYAFNFGLTLSYLYEEMHRELPPQLEFQNERQRNGMWFAAEQSLFEGRDVIAVGWGHAGATVGDPGGQHNFNPTEAGNNQANMYTMQFWHKFDKQLTWYFDWAETINDGMAHYDIGAGGHGIKTDCHDATHAQFIDYSSAGPTTWGGCHAQGFSTGVSYRF